MTAGPNIRINADVSGINKALDELRNKVQQATKPINGKAAIDTAAAKKGVQELQKAVDTLHDSISGSGGAGLGAEGLQDLSSGFEAAVKEASELQEVVAKIGGTGAASLGKSVTATRTLIREMEKVRRLQDALKREGHDVNPGQAGAIEAEFQRRLSMGGAGTRKLKRFGSLAGVMENWRDLSPLSEVDARREHRNLMRSLGFAALPAGGGAGGGGGGPGEPGSPGGGGFWRRALGLNGRTLASEGAGVASAASPALGALMRGGLIGMAAYGATRVIGAAHEKMRSAEDESIGYSDLGRQMGATTSDFEGLRSAVRSASEGLGMAFTETAKLAHQYVGQSGVDGLSPGQLRNEVAGGAGFSRALGLDPSRGVGLFATLRHDKVTSGDADNRRVALLIGDAIGKAGVFSKADDVLSAVENFTQVATRAAFSPANVQGYVGAMAGMMGSAPGLDPAAAAGMIGKLDNGIRNNQDPAARSFFLATMQRTLPGFDATDAGFLSDTGAFGTLQSAYGKGSSAYKMAQARGDKALQKKYEGFAAGDKTTNIDRLMSQMEGRSISTQELKETVKARFNMTDSEAAATITARAKNGGSLSAAIDGFRQYGVDPSKLGDTSIRGLLAVKYGTHNDLVKRAGSLRDMTGKQALSKDESSLLDKAMAEPGKDDGKLREALIKLSATRDMEKNAGDESRESLAAIDNATSRLATELIPIAQSMRSAVATIAEKFGFKDRFGKSEESKKILEERLKAAPDDAARQRILANFKRHVDENSDSFTPEWRAEVGKQFDAARAGDTSVEVGQGSGTRTGRTTGPYRNMQDQLDLLNRPSKYDDLFKEAGEKYKVDWQDLKQISVQESGIRPGVTNHNTNGTTDRGLMQLNDRYDAERGVTNWADPRQNIMAGASVYARALRDSNGNVRGAFRRYNGAGEAAESYADRAMALRNARLGVAPAAPLNKVMATRAAADARVDPSFDSFGMMQLPSSARGAGGPGATPQSVMFQGTFQLKDPRGQQLADPLFFSHMAAPQPAGAR